MPSFGLGAKTRAVRVTPSTFHSMTSPAADKKILPYGRQQIDEDDIAAVVETLRSPFLTTGPNKGKLK